MKFSYIAAQTDGKIIEGEIDAASAADVLAFLATQGLKPISLKKQSITISSKRRLFRGSINIADKVFIARYLSLMLKTGTDLFKAIDILLNDFDKPAVRDLLLEIKSNLEKGQPFYVAFAKYPKQFSQVFINLIRAGELSGNLDKTLERLSEELQREQELRSEVRAAVIYPIILVVVSTFIVFFLVSFALPRIGKIFTTGDIEPPLFSRVVFGIGNFLNEYIIFFLIFFVVAFVSIWVLAKKNLFFRKFSYRFIKRIPLVGKVLKILAVQRFCSTFASLLSSGLPIIEALEITAQAVGDEEMKTAILRVAHEGIAKGLTVGEAFKKEIVFPKTLINLIVISEKSGHIENILFTLSDFYESEVKTSVKTLVSFLEPVLLLVIGLVVGVIALSVIVPVYQLVGQI